MATCFVIVGFGAKTDFRPNPRRVLNPSVTCEDIIKPSVERVDLDCVRADEIVRPPVIDKPMCDHLFNADLLIADLWMSNADAIHEPGARPLGHP